MFLLIYITVTVLL